MAGSAALALPETLAADVTGQDRPDSAHMRTQPAIVRVSRLQDDLVVAVLELQMKFVVAELCLRVRFTRGEVIHTQGVDLIKTTGHTCCKEEEQWQELRVLKKGALSNG